MWMLRLWRARSGLCAPGKSSKSKSDQGFTIYLELRHPPQNLRFETAVSNLKFCGGNGDVQTMRTPKVPPRTRVLTTYKELQFHLREFMKGTFNFLWLYGPPGVGKTQAIKAAMRGHKVCYLKGRKSPAAFYV